MPVHGSVPMAVSPDCRSVVEYSYGDAYVQSYMLQRLRVAASYEHVTGVEFLTNDQLLVTKPRVVETWDIGTGLMVSQQRVGRLATAMVVV
jgi:hypothetical protein